MQVQNQVEQVYSIVPVKDIQSEYALQKKHWHILASAEFMIPQLTFSVKITEILLMFDMKIYLSIEIAIIPMVGPSQLKIEYQEVGNIEGYKPIENIEQFMAIGSGTFELPVCPRCFLGYSCNKHDQH